MSNMSYCRFQNTLMDFMDCYHHLHDEDLSDDEASARKSLIEKCKDVAEEFEDE